MAIPHIYPWKKEEIEAAIKEECASISNADITDNNLADSITSVTARMAEKTTTRTNRVAEKAALEFFSLADKNRTLPNPAVVPVKFYQTTTKETSTVPAQTQVSTLTSDLKKPVLFETATPLTVVKPDLKKCIVADFDRNRYEDKSNLIETIVDNPEKLYNTDTPFTYDLHVHHPMLDELGDGKEFWIQPILQFLNESLVPKKNSSSLFTPKHAKAFDFDNDDIFDLNLFRITLSFTDQEGKTISKVLKDTPNSIREIQNNDICVYAKPILFTKKPAERSIIAFNGEKEEKITKRFITISMEITNREYFNFYDTPILENVHLKLFHKPEVKDGFLQFGNTEEFIPKYRDVTNIERAFYNDKELDITKPFKPFGDNPQLGDTFSFSSRFFSMQGETCEINLWMMGDLLGSDFSNEDNPNHKVYCNDVLLGWEYFDGKEWKIFGTSDHTATYEKSPLNPPEAYGKFVSLNNKSSSSDNSFIDGSNGFTNSASKTLNGLDRQYPGIGSVEIIAPKESDSDYPVITFKIPSQIKKCEINKNEDWWIRVRILRGGSYSRPMIQDDNARIEQTALIKPPYFRTFTVNYSNSNLELFTEYFYHGAPAMPCKTIISQNAMSLTKIASEKVIDTVAEIVTEEAPVIKRFSSNETADSERMLFLGFSGDEIVTAKRSLFFSITPDLSMILPKDHLLLKNQKGVLDTKNSDGSNRLIPELIWQYWDGKAWKKLEVTDRTNGLTTAQSLEFILPTYAQKRTLFGDSFLWIRGYAPKKQTSLTLLNTEGEPITVCLDSTGTQIVDIYNENGALYVFKKTTKPNSNAIVQFNTEDTLYLDSNQKSRVFPYHDNYSDSQKTADLAYIDTTTDSPSLNNQLQIQGINQNMVLAESFETIHNEILGNSQGKPNQRFSFVSKPVAANPVIYVREADVIGNEEHMLIKRDNNGLASFIHVSNPQERAELLETGLYEDSVTILDNQDKKEIWVEWQEVPEFTHSEPQDRHYVIDHVNGTITFGDSINGRIPDAGHRNIKAVRYRYGGGAGANINIGEIRNIVSSIPYISRVKNLSIAKGGDNLESNEEIFYRATRDIASFSRAVIEEDYEALALAATGGIKRVKAYSGLRPDGAYQLGWVTLVLIADQLGNRPVPSGEFMNTVENYLANRTSVANVNEYAHFNPLHAAKYENDIYLNNIAVVPPNYITTWIEASITFNSEKDERTRIPSIREKLSSFLHATTGGPTGEGWHFGRDVYISEMSRLVAEMEGVKEVKELRLKANQMRFSLQLDAGIEIEKHHLRGQKAIPSGAVVNTTYPKAMKNGKENEDFTFSFLSSKPIEANDTQITLEGFKEGDILTLKTLCNIAHEGKDFKKQEKKLGHARVTSVETHFFGGFVKTDSGDIIQGISHFRIYLQPMSLKLPGYGEIPSEGITKYIVKNTLGNDALIVAEAQHGTFPLTGESKKITTYVKQLITTNGSIFRRMGGEVIEQTNLRNDEMRHSNELSVKSLPQLGDEEVLAIDVAIPNLWGTVTDDEAFNGIIPPVNIYPMGVDSMVTDTKKGELKAQRNVSLDPENIFYYEELNSEQKDIDSDRFLLIPEFTEQVFLGPTDLPTTGHHRIITDILLSEGEDPIAHTSVENSTRVPGSESQIWYKTLFTKEKYMEYLKNPQTSEIRTVVEAVQSGAKDKINELDAQLENLLPDDPKFKELAEERRIYNALFNMGQDVTKTTDPKSMSKGAFIPELKELTTL